MNMPLGFISTKQILIVDDEPFNLTAIMVVLKATARQLGFHSNFIDSIVDQELSGTQAVAQVIENKKEYRLIITDLSMPVMDGYETAIKIR